MPVDPWNCGRKTSQSIDILESEAVGDTYIAAHGGRIEVGGMMRIQLGMSSFEVRRSRRFRSQPD